MQIVSFNILVDLNLGIHANTNMAKILPENRSKHSLKWKSNKLPRLSSPMILFNEKNEEDVPADERSIDSSSKKNRCSGCATDQVVNIIRINLAVVRCLVMNCCILLRILD